MALTKLRSPGAREVAQPERRNLLGNRWVQLGSVGAVLLLFGGVFLIHPTLSPPTRDPAWYTWRAELLAHAPPSAIVREWGPFGMFSGGYRVTTPLLGAFLIQVAGVSRFTFSILVMVAAPALAGLALGAFAWRHRRDPLLFLLTLFATGALFLTTPYVGYMDNIICLYILALTLPFIRPARTSWGARSALAVLMFLATMTHPTTTAIFVAVLAAGAGLHLLTSRFSIVATWRGDGPMLVACAAGVVVGLAMWKVGAWGVKAPFADAALPPPYPGSVFRSQLGQWVASLKPVFTGPLIAIALGSIAAGAVRRRERKPMDEYPRMTLLWLLPYLGVLGFLAGLAYPYYRFMNTTLAVVILVAMGAWILVRFLLKRSAVAGVLAGLLILGGLGWTAASGLANWANDAPTARFLDPPTRIALRSVDAYVGASDPGRPVVFIANYRNDRRAWGWAKTFANTARSGLSGDRAERSEIYFGTVEDYAAGRPTGGGITLAKCEEHVPLNKVYDCLSLGFFHEMTRGLEPFEQQPMVFLVSRFNGGTTNLDALQSAGAKLGPDVAVLSGPHAAPVDTHAAQVATAAGRAEAAYLADPPGRFADPFGIIRVLLVVGAALILPGLIAAEWFELEDFPTKLALVPGLSIALLLVSGIAILAVRRAAFGVAEGIASLVLACLIAALLGLLARRRKRGRAVVMPFVNRSLSLLENRNFAFLMGAVFLAVLGDGIVQGALAKTIAFGGKAGFSLEEATSARHILALVLLTYLPYTFVSPFVGVLIDRFDRRKLLVLANGVRAAVVAVVGIGLVGAGHLPDPVLIGALLLTLASTRLVLAIKSASIPAVLSRRNLMQGNSISQAGSAVFQIAGAAVALVGTKIASAGLVVAGGACVYAVGAVVASRVASLEERKRTTRFGQEVRRILRNIRDGIREVGHRPPAKLGLFSFLTLRSLVSFVALVFALEVRQILGGGSSKQALLIAAAAGALGAALGFVAAQLLKDRVPPARLIVGSLLVAGAGTVAFGGFTKVLGLSVVAFVSALGYFLGKISADTIMQQSLPDQYRGRGFSFFDVAYNMAWIVPGVVLFALWSGGRAGALVIGAGVLFLTAAAVVAAWSKRLGAELRELERGRADAGSRVEVLHSEQAEPTGKRG
jgi:Major Facilitator Superfamily